MSLRCFFFLLAKVKLDLPIACHWSHAIAIALVSTIDVYESGDALSDIAIRDDAYAEGSIDRWDCDI
jgi:hypothetical protein